MKTLRLTGKVTSGAGEGAKFVGLPWAKKQMEEKLGFSLFVGTLNVKLGPASAKLRESLMGGVGMEIVPVSGYCRGRLFRARVGRVDCGVVVPEVAGYPKDLVEVVSSVNLRRKLVLDDGSSVEIDVVF